MNIFTKVNSFLLNSKLKLKVLLQDVFEKNKETVSQEKNSRKLTARLLPNCVDGENEFYNGPGGIIKYFPEDVEKMKNMALDEKINYKRLLRQNRKYYEIDSTQEKS